MSNNPYYCLSKGGGPSSTNFYEEKYSHEQGDCVEADDWCGSMSCQDEYDERNEPYVAYADESVSESDDDLEYEEALDILGHAGAK